MILEYRTLPEGDRKRNELEQRIGKKMFTKLIAKYEEELLNMKWLEASTMACPRCNVHVEKSLGCNHVCFEFTFCRLRIELIYDFYIR